jgi:hypothetical protein
MRLVNDTKFGLAAVFTAAVSAAAEPIGGPATLAPADIRAQPQQTFPRRAWPKKFVVALTATALVPIAIPTP